MTGQNDDRPGDPPGEQLYLSPYELWNFGVGKPYAFPGIRKWSKYLTALAEIPSKDDLKVTEDVGIAAAGEEPRWWRPTLWKPEELSFVPFVAETPMGFDLTPAGLLKLLQKVAGNFVPAIFPPATFQPGAEAKRRDIKRARFRVAFPVPDCAMHSELPYTGPTDPGCDREHLGIDQGKHLTVVAVIDDGLPFAHRNFRDADGKTRVEFCWLQSAEIDESQKTVLFGREYARCEIDELIERYGKDEDALYRDAGATRDAEDFGSLLGRHATHGAHVMDLAAGYAEERDEIPPKEIRIIAVQLPNTIAWDTSGFGKDMYMLSALHYIFNRADIIACRYGVKNLRLVVNFSYGFSGGRHDGGTELEAAIDELVRKRRDCGCPTALVLPAGNTFLEGMHGQILTPENDDEIRIRWRLQPNSRTPSYLELWFDENSDPAGHTIEIRDPWDRCRLSKLIEVKEAAKPEDDPMQSDIVYEGDFAPIGQVSVDKHRQERWRALVVLAPTEPEDTSLGRTESGEWMVIIKRGENGQPLNAPIRCWIQRAADPETLRSGSRQSYFGDPKNVRHTPEGDLNEEDTVGAFVRRFGSLNGLATGRTALIVAGYRLGAGLECTLDCALPARYSSAGELGAVGHGMAVSCSSMSDRSKVLPGTAAAGVRSGSRSLVQGTSVAAPFVARQLVETFVTAIDTSVSEAEQDNYGPLLCGYRPEVARKNGENAKEEWRKEADRPTTARLGAVRIPPHWQPGIERRACVEDESGGSPVAR